MDDITEDLDIELDSNVADHSIGMGNFSTGSS